MRVWQQCILGPRPSPLLNDEHSRTEVLTAFERQGVPEHKLSPLWMTMHKHRRSRACENDESWESARLGISWSSLERAISLKIWAQVWMLAWACNWTLERAIIWVGKKLYGFSNPISTKTQFSTPDYPKHVLTDVYGFNMQQCTTKYTKQQHQTTIHLVSQQLFIFFKNLTFILSILTNIIVIPIFWT